MHPTTGKREDYQDPSLGLDTVFVCKDRSEDVSLTVGERRLDRFEDVRDISFKSCKLFSLIHPGQDFFRIVIILQTPE